MRAITVGLLSSVAFVTTAAAEPLRIAVMEPLSGSWSQIGTAFVEGTTYGIDRINAAGGFNGEKIEVTVYDNLGSPKTASEKLQDAIDKDVDIVITSSFSGVTAQLSADIKRHNARNPGNEIIYFNNGSEGYDLTAERCQFWYFRAATNAPIRFGALVPTMQEAGTLGDKVYLINPNYSYGQEAQKAQQVAVEKAGVSVVGNDLHDLHKIQDFSPYVAKIKSSGATSVLTSNFESDLTLLLKAAQDAGLQIPFANQSLDSPGTLASAGPAAKGSYLAKLYVLDAGGEAGKAFNEDFKAKIGRYPSYEQATSAFSLALLGEALKAVDFGGGEIDTVALAKALESAKWESPVGEWSFRADDHQLIAPLIISEVSPEAAYKADGTEMGFAVVRIVPPQEAAVPVDPACKMERPD